MALTNEQKHEQKLWGEFYRVLHDEAKSIRLLMLRQKLAKTTAGLEDEQPAPVVNPSGARI